MAIGIEEISKLPSVNYEGLTDTQRWIKRGIVIAVRAFMSGLPTCTEALIVQTVEGLWREYNE